MRKNILIALILLGSIGAVALADVVSTGVYKDVKLKVPAYKQQYANSCEASTLRMALAYKNIVLRNDVQVLARIGYNPTVKDYARNVWTDPQKQFVGYVDVTGSKGGYGVYGLPVVDAIKSYGLQAEYATGTAITASFLADAIDKGNPVIVWGYSSYTEPPYTWKTEDGTEVKAFRGEHVRLVTGFRGSVDNPIGFYFNDSLTGKNTFWTTAKLMENINKVPGVTDQAVVVK